MRAAAKFILRLSQLRTVKGDADRHATHNYAQDRDRIYVRLISNFMVEVRRQHITTTRDRDVANNSGEPA